LVKTTALRSGIEAQVMSVILQSIAECSSSLRPSFSLSSITQK